MQDQYHIFRNALHIYQVVPESLSSLYSKEPTKVVDPAKRRELKIKQYKQEKEFRSKINVCRNSLLCDCLTLTPDILGDQKTAGTKASTIRTHRL